MLNDLVELATTVVHPDHEPDIAGASTMARRRQGSKSQSVSDINGMLPPPSPASKSGTPARKPRSRSTTSPLGSPKPVISVTRGAERSSVEGVGKYFGAVLLSIVAEMLLNTVTSQFGGTGELAGISKLAPTSTEAGGLLAWKILLLTFHWYSGFDAYDVASLTLLIQTPTNVLLGFFYAISTPTLIASTVTSVVANTLPYLIFRPISPSHDPSNPLVRRVAIRNRPILNDPWTTLATSLLATAIFSTTLLLAFTTYLPIFLTTHFTTLRSLTFAHQGAAGLPTLLLALLPAGYACTEFLFAPATAATPFTAPDFDPATSGFLEHIYWNLWGWYSARQRTLIVRAVVLGALMSAETVVYAVGSMQNVELLGALGYAGVWASSVSVLTWVLDWVGGPSD